jgi:integrase
MCPKCAQSGPGFHSATCGTPSATNPWSSHRKPTPMDAQPETLVSPTIASRLRRGAVWGLFWSDIDLVDGTVTVTHSRVPVNRKTMDSQPRTDNSVRRLPLTPALTAALRRHRPHAPPGRGRRRMSARWRRPADVGVVGADHPRRRKCLGFDGVFDLTPFGEVEP